MAGKGLTYKDCLRHAQQLEAAAADTRRLADEFAASAAQWHERARQRADCCSRCDGRPSSYPCTATACRCTLH